jgi:hypothetical protein
MYAGAGLIMVVAKPLVAEVIASWGYPGEVMDSEPGYRVAVVRLETNQLTDPTCYAVTTSGPRAALESGVSVSYSVPDTTSSGSFVATNWR